MRHIRYWIMNIQGKLTIITSAIQRDRELTTHINTIKHHIRLKLILSWFYLSLLFCWVGSNGSWGNKCIVLQSTTSLRVRALEKGSMNNALTLGKKAIKDIKWKSHKDCKNKSQSKEATLNLKLSTCSSLKCCFHPTCWLCGLWDG